jgi:transposase InsO family protein
MRLDACCLSGGTAILSTFPIENVDTIDPAEDGWFPAQRVGWSMDTSMSEQLVCDALRMAANRREPQADALHHSDQGSQYASQKYQQLLDDLGMRSRMPALVPPFMVRG